MDQSCPDRNTVVLRGTLSSAPVAKTLPSGTKLCQLELTTREVAGGTHTVPVVQFDGPDSTDRLSAGAQIVVTGHVRRRFFRAGGSTQSRTEVVADRVVPGSQQKKVAAAFERALGNAL